MIYVSTAAFPELTGIQAVDLLAEHGILAAELSSGRYSPTLAADLKSRTHGLIVVPHHYFPPAETPFVINLASPGALGEQSLTFASRSIQLAAEIGSSHYSIHAGYRLDPAAHQLGGLLHADRLIPLDQAEETFARRVRHLAAEATAAGVTLLIENNVLTRSNLERYQEDPLLMTTPSSIESLLDKIGPDVGLLMDVAHLRVSASTLGFDPVAALHRLGPRIRGLHLSENDGVTDSNHPVDSDSWFWNHVPPTEYCTLEIYRASMNTLKEQLALASRLIKTNTTP